ncbi:MAG: cation:proton antiporter [Bacteroidetes bacterium]|nr:cation:proton antiporter [Bacteroidota bacterium]
MVLLADLNLSLPLTNPVVIFSLVLFIILFVPLLLKKINVSHIIGLILAGVIVGPYALNLLSRDSSIVLFGTVGLLYIMFLAGLEIDLTEFKRNKAKILTFGLLTFLLPLIAGSLASHYVLGYDWLASILLASMFSTHTLVSYPIVSKYGIAQNKAVALTVGGTMITDILALVILAIVAGMTKGKATPTFWVTLGVSSLAFCLIVFLVFPILIRWFFKRKTDSVSQYIFVLGIVFLASFLAEAAGLEAIIGAFFAGLVLNKFVPHTSPLMNRIDFVGNALFIPFFLIGIGMLVNFNVIFNGWGALKVAGVVVFVAIVSKYLAAWITQKSFKMSAQEGRLIFGLSTSHAAATLAIILVGYNIIIGETAGGEPIRLLDENILNGTILLILISCAVSSFVVDKAARKIASEQTSDTELEENEDDILVVLDSLEVVPEIVDFSLLLKKRKDEKIFALSLVNEEDQGQENGKQNQSKKMMDAAVKLASSSESIIVPLTRYDFDKGNGIVSTLKEQKLKEIVLTVDFSTTNQDAFDPILEKILEKTQEAVFAYRSAQSFNTLSSMRVVLPPNAELEIGFKNVVDKLLGIAKSGGLSLHFFATPITIQKLKLTDWVTKKGNSIDFVPFENWDDFLVLSREVRQNDFFVIMSSRPGCISYLEQLKKVPYYLANYFKNVSVVVVYPEQYSGNTWAVPGI